MQGKYVKIDKDILIKAYEDSGRSMRATGIALDTSEKTVMRRMKEYGIEWDKKVYYSCNEDFFDELNEQSLYWLGFLAADGWLYKHQYSYEICLKLAEEDSSHLQKFKLAMNSLSPIHRKIEKHKAGEKGFLKDEYASYQITITSEKLFNRLAEFNIVPAKTHIYRFPEQLKDHSDVRHFIRGCLDGDGWWREHKNNGKDYTTDIRVGMCGTPIFIREVFDIITERCVLDSGSYYVRKSGKTADFEFCAKDDVNYIADWLYKDATIYLPRKREIAIKAKQLI
ncbi:MAG TPA: hypothetical protein VII94_05975 [Candidatus Saccharimonadales bacterium]